MNFFRKPLALFVLSLLLIPVSGFTQYVFQVEPFFNYFSQAGRYELKGNYVLPTATFEGSVRVENGGYFKGDSTLKRGLTNVMAYGGSLGLSIPIKATGHISCWAVAMELMGNMYAWQDLNQKMGSDGSFTSSSPALSASTLQVALPIGLEWKVGCDAIMTKRLPLCTAMGAGVIPQLNMTNVDNVSGVDGHMAFGCTPYAKLEVGFFIGMCVKLRAMYTMGDIQLIDVNHALPKLNDGQFKITSNSNVILSFIIMPFSGGWGEYDWISTHDTYNQHDRLN